MNAQFVYDRQSISPVLFKRNVLGHDVNIIIGKFKGKITLPVLQHGAATDFKPVLAPPNFNKGVLHLIHTKDEAINWGRQIALPGGETVVENYLMEFDLAKTKEAARQQISLIETDLDNWFLLVRDWLEVLTKQDLSVSEPLGGVQDKGNFMWSWKARKVWRNTTASTIALVLSASDRSHAVKLKQWVTAIDNASAGKSVPEEYLLLRDARARLRRYQYNYSIIFSAIATELVLKNKLEEVLTANRKSRRLINDVMNNTLGKIIEICEVLGVMVPVNTRADLLAPRNRAMHRHVQLSMEEAKKCLEVSDKIVSTHSKL